MVDMRRVRLEIFRRTRSHSYMCLMYGGSWVFGFDRCGCDKGNKKQYLRDILVTDMAKGEHAELRKSRHSQVRVDGQAPQGRKG